MSFTVEETFWYVWIHYLTNVVISIFICDAILFTVVGYYFLGTAAISTASEAQTLWFLKRKKLTFCRLCD